MLIKSNDFIKHWAWLMGVLLIVAAIIFGRFRSSEEGRFKIDKWKMNMPIVGKVVCLHLFGQFSRTLATLLQNGVPVLNALEITEQVIPNRVLKQAIAKTRQDVTDGKTIAQPLARSKVFPQLMVDLIKIGEETGDVPGSLANLADTYESQLNIGLKVMTNMIEPVIICVMAVFVGFLLIAVLQALFSVVSNISVH
jgi:type II secretory pathway component PulF